MSASLESANSGPAKTVSDTGIVVGLVGSVDSTDIVVVYVPTVSLGLLASSLSRVGFPAGYETTLNQGAGLAAGGVTVSVPPPTFSIVTYCGPTETAVSVIVKKTLGGDRLISGLPDGAVANHSNSTGMLAGRTAATDEVTSTHPL